MPPRLKAVFEQIALFWAQLPTAKRLALVTLTVGALLTVLAVSWWNSQIRYGYLYTDLSTEDAAAIVQKLEAQQVPYKLDDSGTAIKVPDERVHALRLELAGAGLPRGSGVGFELFDKSQIGATEFEQHVSLKRALEGELARSIGTLEGVSAARVHLVLPERRLFASREQEASASVVLKLKNPAGFGKREVSAIVHLVSTAVPGLGRDRVSVVSTEGLTLHRPVTGDAVGAGSLADLHTENARAVASQMESLVKEQLERVVGAGNADVRVNVALDSRSKERTEEHYEPNKTALRSEHEVIEGSGAGEAGVAGVPGARSNLPDAVDEGTAPPEEALAAAGPGGTSRRSHTRNWEVDKVTEKMSTPPGDIERISVAVLVNGRYEQRDGKSVYVGRSKQDMKRLEDIVKNAVGFSTNRGDSVELQTMEFAKVSDGDLTPPPPLPWWRRYAPYLAAGGAALIAFIALLVLVRKGRKASIRQAKAIASVEKAAEQLSAAPDIRALMADPRPNAAELKSKALELAAQDPATAAVVLRKWLSAAAQPQARS
ncbi:MAG: flagellar M-ring protein FliF [Myxococcales bacterium]|nr:flagellar M-ring protein FliF [Myxococcales bacterium]MCB9579340.1 flagellar M-ring protein FliF [Polyangiaceae bacterium]